MLLTFFNAYGFSHCLTNGAGFADFNYLPFGVRYDFDFFFS